MNWPQEDAQWAIYNSGTNIQSIGGYVTQPIGSFQPTYTPLSAYIPQSIYVPQQLTYPPPCAQIQNRVP